MKKNLLRHVAAAGLAVFVTFQTSPLRAQSASAGTVSGQVIDAQILVMCDQSAAGIDSHTPRQMAFGPRLFF